MTSDPNGQQRPASREFLRAELQALELRLRDRFDVLATKADVDTLRSRVAEVEREAQRLENLRLFDRVETLERELLDPEAVGEIVGRALEKAKARGWTTRERMMGVALFLLTVATFALNALSRVG